MQTQDIANKVIDPIEIRRNGKITKCSDTKPAKKTMNIM